MRDTRMISTQLGIRPPRPRMVSSCPPNGHSVAKRGPCPNASSGSDPRKARTKLGGNVSARAASLGEDAFAALWAEGRAMTLEQVIAYALEETAQA